MKKGTLFLALWLAVSSFAILNLQDNNNKKTVQVTSKQIQKSTTAQYMEQQGLVDIKSVDPTIKVALMYARTDNFCRKLLYTNLREAYALPQCAAALKKAQTELKRLRPDLSLIIFDATRPMSVQQTMWDAVKHTNHSFYVSNPANGGGMHNYGMAVDISICKALWNEKQWREGSTPCRIDTIPMGVKVDHLGYESHIDKEQQLLAKGILTKESLANRQLLRRVMKEAGFQPLRTEWWHFNLCSRAWAKANLKVVK
ncbi:M15 family metallopeptidase [Prevotella aurantiaca]|jgi:D-ala-D-ala dipeptidase|uniref:D-alanyl-D-alanine dipeptidase n=1 Tax=Prevotella aurantiaca TaxID=596085 RepID=A0A930HMC5_9BACT|nr:M15 family metallopeptidase [Prevotella aurantiaca]MBF1384333.1 M15 family metallopeptidase [Prevotella aurantiaca]